MATPLSIKLHQISWWIHAWNHAVVLTSKWTIKGSRMLNRPFKWKFPKMVVPQNNPICFNRSFYEINFKKTIQLLGDLHFKNPPLSPICAPCSPGSSSERRGSWSWTIAPAAHAVPPGRSTVKSDGRRWGRRHSCGNLRLPWPRLDPVGTCDDIAV